MRKSAAPSVLGQKKSRFVVPYACYDNKSYSTNDNVLKTSVPVPERDAKNVFKIVSCASCNDNDDLSKGGKDPLFNNDALLNTFKCPSLFEPFPTSDLCTSVEEPKSSFQIDTGFDCVSVEKNESVSLTANEVLITNSSEISLQHPVSYNVLWCKRSMKKHKKWEGDAILSVRGCSAVLKDMEGNEIAKGIGYKIKEVIGLTEGSTFFISGKECEIQSVISEVDNFAKTGCVKNSSNTQTSVRPSFVKKFRRPITNGSLSKLPPTSQILGPQSADAVYMPRPNVMHEYNRNFLVMDIVDVKIDPILSKHLRPHQKEGVIFMYECIMGFKDPSYHGVILGDEMGLGKTLQCITLIWTLYKQGPYNGKPVLKKVLIITPCSLVKNWQSEFFKWLGRDRIPIFAVSQNKKVKDFVQSKHTVLIISYEMFIRSVNALSSVKFDLVICDEGHRLKNMNIKTSNVIMTLPILKRILLTGTPIQNDLGEFYSIAEFVNPGILGSSTSFRKTYEDPITKSRHPDCTEDERILGEERAAELSAITSAFMLRRTQEVINKYLPPKIEAVIFVRPSDLQCNLYEHLLQSRAVQYFLTMEGFGASHSPLGHIIALRKLCNHPSLLKMADPECAGMLPDDSVQEHMQSAFPMDYVYSPHHSGKMKVLECLLQSLFNLNSQEKIVLVSNFVRTLDLIEDLCKAKGYCYLRLDGSTNTSSRLDLVDQFNTAHSKFRVFLLSSKAGGVGLNLIGASRILLYDIDWNPATDLQAMARVWRDGQRRLVYVYRLITAGTIEEKMYQRQISKQELYGTVIDSSTKHKSQFSNEELKDLFTFHRGVLCQTHDIIKCTCLTSSSSIQDKDGEEKGIENPFRFTWAKKTAPKKNTTMDELLKWKHISGLASGVDFPNSCLETCGPDVTFLFVNTVNFNIAAKTTKNSVIHHS